MKQLLCVLSFSILFASVASARVPAKEASAKDAAAPAQQQPKANRSGKEPDSPIVVAVKKELIKPLALRDSSRSKYSRVPSAPAERHVRVPDATPKTDKNGKQFVTFVVDAKQYDELTKAAMTGCVYTGSNEVFVKRGDEFRPASAFVSPAKAKETHPAELDGVCVATDAPTT